MPKFAANLSLLFTERPLADRFAAAARAGFGGVEVLFPYGGKSAVTANGLAAHGLEMVLMNAPYPDASGALGCAANPGAEPLFKRQMMEILDVAAILRPGLIHVMSGDGQGGDARRSFVRNLQWLADLAPAQGFAIEPLNPTDRPEYFLNGYDLAAEVLMQVDRPNIGLQYDTYHAAMISGDAMAVWESFGDLAVHVQIGAAPNRDEPGQGDFDFPGLFANLDSGGYAGWVSAEYHPSRRTEDTLGWMA